MEHLKIPALLLLVLIVGTALMKTGMLTALHATGGDQALEQVVAAKQAFSDPAEASEALAKEYERTHPGQKFKPQSARRSTPQFEPEFYDNVGAEPAQE